MKSLILISLGLIAVACGCEANKPKVFTKPLGLDTQDLCARMPDGILIADSQDCRLFYYCLNNHAEPVRCRAGYYFDQETSYCLRGRCPSHANHKICSSEHDQFTRIEGKCNSFSVCHNGMQFDLECPLGHYFSDEKKTCVEIANNAHHKCACIMPEHTTLENEHNCKSYFVCSEGRALLQQCEKGSFFNDELNTCVPDVRGACDISILSPNEKPEKIPQPQPQPEPKPESMPEPKPMPIHERPPKEDKLEIADENQHKPVVSEDAKQAFLDDIHEQLIEKKKLEVQKHQEKVEIYEKCLLNEPKKEEKPEVQVHKQPKPVKKESEPEVQPEPMETAPKPVPHGVYHKLNSKFVVL